MAQGVVVGDAVVKFFADLTDYDQAIAGLNQLPQRLKPAQDAADSLGESFSAVGPAASESATVASSAGQRIAAAGTTGATGIKGTDTAVQQLIIRMKAMEAESAALQAQVVALQTKLGALGEEGQGAGRKLGSSFREAQGTAALLGEATGVHLPRHVRTFLATLPGVSAALSSAFSAVAILFLIDAAVKLIEKFQQWRQEAELARAAWDAQTDSIHEHNDALRLANDELQKALNKFDGKVSDNLAIALDTARVKADELAKSLTKDVDELQALTKTQSVSLFDRILGNAGTGDIEDALKQKFDAIKKVIRNGKEAIRAATETGNLDETNRITGEAAIAEDRAYAEAVDYVAAQLKIATAEQDRFTLSQQHGSKELGLGAEDQTKRIALLTSLLDNLKDAEDVASLSAKNLGLNVQKAFEGDKGSGAADAAAQAKRDLQEELGTIETVRTRQHLLFAEGKLDATDWALAQKRAADASLDAQSKYQDKLVAIAQTFSGSAKAQEAAQQAVIEKTKLENQNVETLAAAVEKHREGVRKLYEEWDHLQQVSVAKLWNEATKASEELTKAEEKLTQAEKNLAVARAQSTASQQEAAINRLAQFAIISEEEKEKRLKKIYDEEHRDAINALTRTLGEEQKAVAEYQSKLDSNPFFSDAQKKDLEKNLDEAKARVLNTQAQIVKSDEEYRKKTEGLTAAERNLIAAQLAGVKAQEQELQVRRQLAIEQGQSTKDIDKEIAATKKYEGELARLLTRMTGVTKTKPTWDSFFTDLITKSLSAGEAFKQMGDLFADAMSQSVASALSGAQSFGQAFEQILKSTLASLAGVAVGHVLTEVAKASSDFATAATLAADPFTAALAPGFITSAHAHLVAAAEWGALGAGAAVGAAAIPSGSSSGSSSPTNSNVNIGANGQAAPQPSGGQNVPKLATGAYVTKRTLAMIGDAPSGAGDAPEAIVPLDNEVAKQGIADALVGNLVAAFSGVRQSDLPNFVPPELAAEIASPQNFTRATLRAGAEAVSLGSESSRSRPQTSVHHHHYDQRTTVQVDMPIQGVISADTLDKLAPKMAKVISKHVRRGTVRLDASTSRRTRKSQIKR